VQGAASTVVAIWKRTPVLLRAVFTGLLVATAGTLPWAVLVSFNLRYWSGVPWAVPPTALYLWLFWRYVRGEGWPRSTAETRRANCRANSLSEEALGAALIAGVLGLGALMTLLGVLGRMVSLPPQRIDDFSRVPLVTLVCWLIMSAVVAGIAEESSFRGYMQGPIERRHGPAIAILVTGMVFGFMHFTHPEVTLVLMPYYMAVAAVYGALAYLANSILPSVMLHAGGNMLAAVGLFAGGRSEWQGVSSPGPLVWETGTDGAFWASCAAFVIAGSAAAWAFAALAAVTRRDPRA
jgi:membrane protease YdiL (CAAX protease family)